MTLDDAEPQHGRQSIFLMKSLTSKDTHQKEGITYFGIIILKELKKKARRDALRVG